MPIEIWSLSAFNAEPGYLLTGRRCRHQIISFLRSITISSRRPLQSIARIRLQGSPTIPTIFSLSCRHFERSRRSSPSVACAGCKHLLTLWEILAIGFMRRLQDISERTARSPQSSAGKHRCRTLQQRRKENEAFAKGLAFLERNDLVFEGIEVDRCKISKAPDHHEPPRRSRRAKDVFGGGGDQKQKTEA